MSSTRPVTAEELLAMGEGKRELILGEVVELTPPGLRHGRIQARIAHLIMGFLEEAGSGDLVTTESGYQLTFKPDTVRAPDVAVIAAARAEGREEEIGYLPFAPDLAVEVVSPSDSFADVEAKAQMWLEHGAYVVWVVEPESRRVMVHVPDRDRRALEQDETLDGAPVLPGFTISVAKLLGS
ncbi:MAG: Uma2 family endonuclease [Planctomycetota bacterium]